MTSQGAAFLAGLAVGFWQSKEELKHLRKTTKMYQPNKVPTSEIDRRYSYWLKAIDSSYDWAKE